MQFFAPKLTGGIATDPSEKRGRMLSIQPHAHAALHDHTGKQVSICLPFAAHGLGFLSSAVCSAAIAAVSKPAVYSLPVAWSSFTGAAHREGLLASVLICPK